MSIAIVTDSTSDLTAEEYESLRIHMVPLSIEVDGVLYKDQREISSEAFYDAMIAAENLPKTSQPAPLDFMELYKSLEANGCTHIFSFHIAGTLSGTVESALMAAQEVSVPVTVVDSCGTTVSLALLLKEVCALRDAGKSAEEIHAAAQKTIAQTKTYLVPLELDNLLKGGRLSEAEVTQANVLNIKPIFTFTETGTLAAHSKAKGMSGAVKQCVKDITARTEEAGVQRIRFCHVRNEEAVEQIRTLLAKEGIDVVDEGVGPCGATIATHVGIGAFCVACAPVK